MGAERRRLLEPGHNLGSLRNQLTSELPSAGLALSACSGAAGTDAMIPFLVTFHGAVSSQSTEAIGIAFNGIGAIGLEGAYPRFLNYEAELADGPECHGNFDDSLALSLENSIPPGGNPTSATYGFFTVNESYGQSAVADQAIMAEAVLSVGSTQTVDAQHDTGTVQSATGPGITNVIGSWYFTLDGNTPPAL